MWLIMLTAWIVAGFGIAWVIGRSSDLGRTKVGGDGHFPAAPAWGGAYRRAGDPVAPPGPLPAV